MEKRTQQIVAASVSAAGSALQLQAVAAPRSGGLWDELRPEIAASVEKQGGTADEVDGPFGREILARLPVTTQDGRMGHRPARFIGVDGPRWFLRSEERRVGREGEGARTRVKESEERVREWA